MRLSQNNGFLLAQQELPLSLSLARSIQAGPHLPALLLQRCNGTSPALLVPHYQLVKDEFRFALVISEVIRTKSTAAKKSGDNCGWP
jgi:hypothetical protein